MITAITFDFWQTLFKSQEVDYTERLHQLKERVERGSGLTFALEQFQDAVVVARDTWSSTWIEEHRTITADEWLQIMLTELNINLPAPTLLELQDWMESSVMLNPPALVPEAQPVLADLSSRYRLGIISDTGLTPGRMLRQLLEANNIIGYFSQLTFSDEIGRSKPHPRAFETTLAALEAEPAQAVHIGDMLRTDIAGAQNAGMRGVLYVGVRQDEVTPLTETVTPDATIASHTELSPLLASWNGR